MVSLFLTLLFLIGLGIINRDRTKTEYEYFPNKNVSAKIKYVKIKNEKILHGICTYYYENGQIKTEYNYIGGVMDGVQSHYDKNGKLKFNDIYRNGSLIERFTY